MGQNASLGIQGQGVIGAFSIGEGESLVFYENRTSTGQVTGLFGPLARALGRRMMRREVTAFFREIRKSAAAGSAARWLVLRRPAPGVGAACVAIREPIS